MGIGGFFDYEKPGPGVSKHAPKKKMFFTFLEVWFRNFWKLTLVSIVYSLMSLTLIPCGLGEAGMANVCRNLASDRHSFGLSDFFSTIKKNWKQALPAGLINLFITAALCFALYFYWINGGIFSIIAFGICFSCLTVFTFMKYHVWLLIITFKLSIKKIYKNCFLFAFVNLKYNLLITVMSLLITGGLVALIIFTRFPILWVISILLMIAVMPGFMNLFIQFCIFPKVKTLMIDPYYAQHPEEDKNLRRGLGLEVEEDDESVFDDLGKTVESNE